jgi:hypothetical protein
MQTLKSLSFSACMQMQAPRSTNDQGNETLASSSTLSRPLWVASVVQAAWHRISHDCVGTVSMFYPMGKGVQQASSTQLNTRDQITPGPLAFTQALTTLTGFLYSPCSLPMQDDDAGPSGMQAGQCSACCPCPMPLASDLQTFSTAACTHSTGSSRNGFCLHAPAVLLHLSELLQ